MRLPNKNKMLLKFTLEYLKQYGNKNIILLTDDEEIIDEYKNDYKIIVDENKQHDVLYSINDCAKQLGSKYVFYTCVTNPFRQDGILYEMMDKVEEYDMITTKVIVPNRKIFLIDDNDKFIYKSKKGRKGKYVKHNFMIDGAVYLVKREFLEKICKTKMPNKLFWESNFKTVLNNVPFVDIDTKEDMNNFNFYKNFK